MNNILRIVVATAGLTFGWLAILTLIFWLFERDKR